MLWTGRYKQLIDDSTSVPAIVLAAKRIVSVFPNRETTRDAGSGRSDSVPRKSPLDRP